MKKKLLALFMSLTVALSLAGCGGSGSGQTAGGSSAESAADGGSTDGGSADGGGKTVVIAMEGEGLETFDPGYVYEKYAHVVMNACYENLFKFYDNNGPAQPCLADTYEFSEDGLTLTVTLKDGITFASGNPMTSADVAFSINRCKNLKGNPSIMTDTIDSIETPDEKTVIFHLTEPDSALLSKLTYNALAILDSTVAKENGATDAEDAATADTARNYLDNTSAGSGMYVLTKYTPNEEIVLEKNAGYWGDNASNVDKYIIQLQGEANSQMMTLSTGDIDVALNLTDDTVSELEGNDSVAVLNDPTKTVAFVMMNMDKSIGGQVSDPKVQQAIRKALDYKGTQEIVGSGTVTPYSLIQDGFMGSKGTRDVNYTNIEEAKQLLADAGYPDGFDIDLTVTDLAFEGTPLTDLAQKVKDDLALIGINCNIVTQAWAAGYGDAYRDGTLGFTVMYWGIDYADPNVQLEFLPGSSVGLRAGWQADMDPEIAALSKACMEATDDADRTAILEQIQDATYEHGPFVMIAQAPAHFGYNTRLTGVAVSDPYTLDLTMINIAE